MCRVNHQLGSFSSFNIESTNASAYILERSYNILYPAQSEINSLSLDAGWVGVLTTRRWISGRKANRLKEEQFFLLPRHAASQIKPYPPGISPLHLQDSPDGYLSPFCGKVSALNVRTVPNSTTHRSRSCLGRTVDTDTEAHMSHHLIIREAYACFFIGQGFHSFKIMSDERGVP